MLIYKGKNYYKRFGRWYVAHHVLRCRAMSGKCVGIQGHTHNHFYFYPEGHRVEKTLDFQTRIIYTPGSKLYVPPGVTPTYLSYKPRWLLVRDKNIIRSLERAT